MPSALLRSRAAKRLLSIMVLVLAGALSSPCLGGTPSQAQTGFSNASLQGAADGTGTATMMYTLPDGSTFTENFDFVITQAVAGRPDGVKLATEMFSIQGEAGIAAQLVTFVLKRLQDWEYVQESMAPDCSPFAKGGQGNLAAWS